MIPAGASTGISSCPSESQAHVIIYPGPIPGKAQLPGLIGVSFFRAFNTIQDPFIGGMAWEARLSLYMLTSTILS